MSETVDCTNTQLSSNKTEPGGGGHVAVEASVSCPCNEGGKVLNMSVARARILSQIIALRYVCSSPYVNFFSYQTRGTWLTETLCRIPQWRVNACWNAHSVLAPVIEDKDKSCFYMKWFLTKASFSTMLMISCWRKHCMSPLICARSATLVNAL